MTNGADASQRSDRLLQAREFLSKAIAWPANDNDGYVNIHTLTPGRAGMGGQAFQSLEAAIAFIQWQLSKDANVYVCMSKQREANPTTNKLGRPYYRAIRNQANAVALKSLYADLDVGPEDHKYDTFEEMQTEFFRFIKETGLPRPTYGVRSGNGGHVHWIFNRALTPEEYLSLAYAIVEALKRHGVKCDGGCTTDTARVLRIPDTFNHKTIPPKPVTQWFPCSKEYSYEEIETILEPYKVPVPSLQSKRSFFENPKLFASQSISPMFAKVDTSAPYQGLETAMPRDEIRVCLDLIPNTKVDWNYWNTMGMRVYAASEGQDYGLEEWERWSAKNVAAIAAGKDNCADRWATFHTCPPTHTGAGALITAARNELDDDDWFPRQRLPTESYPQGSEKSHNDNETETVVYEPGNEERCRQAIDRVVAADSKTFVLGDRTGPLVVLRAPDDSTLPEQTRWEGDLPAATLAAPADIMQRAERLSWMKRAGGKGKPHLRRDHPPRQFVADYLTQMQGQYGARILRGVVRVPRIENSGEIRFVSGYDAETGLFHDRSAYFDVPSNPSLDDARRAIEALLLPFSQYSFEDAVMGRAVLLAAIFTAIERPFLSVAPVFLIRSSMPGTGKGLIVRSLVRLAFDTSPTLITWGGSGEEFEKRLGALLLRAPGALSIDNANGVEIEGDLLESVVTEGCADIRPLGRSEVLKIRNRSLITITGNNPNITGDMARRTLALDVQPSSPDPERTVFPFHPEEKVKEHRTVLLRQAFVAMRAYRQAGMPSSGLPGVGSFDDWSRKVRDLVFWLMGCDVSDSFRRNKAEDPSRLIQLD